MSSRFEVDGGDDESLIAPVERPSRQPVSRRESANQGEREVKMICSTYARLMVVMGAVVLGLLVYRFGTGNESQSEFRGEIHVRKPVTERDAFDWEKLSPAFLNRLATSREAVNAQLQAIEEEWDVKHFPFFLTTIHMPRSNYELQVNKFRLRLFDYSQANSSSKFVVGVSGSSVTAGHDNFYSQNYAHVLEDTLRPVFSAMDVSLDVRNRAMGNNPCMPYDLCMPTFMGRDLDVLTWEQSMFCGHDSRPVEAFTRSAFHMDKVPTVMYLSSGTPFWEEQECDPDLMAAANKTAPVLERGPLSDEERNLLRLRGEDYAAIVDGQSFMKDFTFLQPVKNSGVTDTIDGLYAGLPVAGQNVLGLGAYKCQGPFTADFSKRGAEGGNAWHPGVKGHRFRAHSLAYPLLKALSEAMDDFLVRFPEVGTAPAPATLHLAPFRNLRSASLATKAARALTRAPGTTVSCEKKICANGEPKCYTDFLPRQDALPLQPASQYGGLLVAQTTNQWTSSSSSSSSTNGPIKGYKSSDTGRSKSSAMANFLEGIASPTSLTGQVVGSNSTWTQELSFFDRRAVEKGEAKGLGYQDRKLVLVSPANKTGFAEASISFKLQVSAENAALFGGIAWLCELQKGFLAYPEEYGDLDVEAIVAITLDGYHGTGEKGEDLFGRTAPQYVPISQTHDFCYEVEGLKSGHHTLTIWPKRHKRIILAYLITF
jgi:hypothetical protein